MVVLSLAVATAFVEVAWWVRIVLDGSAVVYYLLVDTFTRLRVRVGGEVLRVSFGQRWPRKVIPLAAITAVGARRGKCGGTAGASDEFPTDGCGTWRASTTSRVRMTDGQAFRVGTTNSCPRGSADALDRTGQTPTHNPRLANYRDGGVANR